MFDREGLNSVEVMIKEELYDDFTKVYPDKTVPDFEKWYKTCGADLYTTLRIRFHKVHPGASAEAFIEHFRLAYPDNQIARLKTQVLQELPGEYSVKDASTIEEVEASSVGRYPQMLPATHASEVSLDSISAFNKWYKKNFPNIVDKELHDDEWLESVFPVLAQVPEIDTIKGKFESEMGDITYLPRETALWNLFKQRPKMGYIPCLDKTKTKIVWKKSRDASKNECRPLYVVSFDSGDWCVHKPLDIIYEYTYSMEDHKDQQLEEKRAQGVSTEKNKASEILAYAETKEMAIAQAASLMGVSVAIAEDIWCDLGLASKRFTPKGVKALNKHKSQLISSYDAEIALRETSFQVEKAEIDDKFEAQKENTEKEVAGRLSELNKKSTRKDARPSENQLTFLQYDAQQGVVATGEFQTARGALDSEKEARLKKLSAVHDSEISRREKALNELKANRDAIDRDISQINGDELDDYAALMGSDLGDDDGRCVVPSCLPPSVFYSSKKIIDLVLCDEYFYCANVVIPFGDNPKMPQDNPYIINALFNHVNVIDFGPNGDRDADAYIVDIKRDSKDDKKAEEFNTTMRKAIKGFLKKNAGIDYKFEENKQISSSESDISDRNL